ncbi:hypothetical protein [Streptomyces sp. NPDC050738]|uniref:hypothetical protein n=1 Tax=Streptomyces sp. NPDC050738 TaxID=3154744 RepID=UPI0034227380
MSTCTPDQASTPVAAIPLVVHWDRYVMGPSGDTDRENTIVPCTSADGDPVALVLDSELCHRLALDLAEAAGKSGDSGRLSRRAFLREQIRLRGGRWKSRRVQDLYARAGYEASPRTARNDLQHLFHEGLLIEHDMLGGRYYTPSRKGGDL